MNVDLVLSLACVAAAVVIALIVFNAPEP